MTVAITEDLVVSGRKVKRLETRNDQRMSQVKTDREIQDLHVKQY